MSALCCAIFSAEAQETSRNWGAKAGISAVTYVDRLDENGGSGFDYETKTGFYLGGFANFNLSPKFELQPELVFSHRPGGLQTGEIFISDPMARDGFRYKATITESVLDLPVMFRYFFFRSLFLEAGPQLGYIISRKEEVEEVPSGMQETEASLTDRYDAGVAGGLGVNLNSSFKISTRYFLGLVKRENMVSSSVINLGLEYCF